MSAEQLTAKNSHRAAKVRLVANPERGVWDWIPYHKVQQEASTVHPVNIARKEESEVRKVVNLAHYLSNWEVVEFAYEQTFEDLFMIARDAFYMTSHQPEERACHYISMYDEMVQQDMALMSSDRRTEYYNKFRAKIIDLFNKHSRIASSAIVGPARFPTEKNRRANESFDKAAREFNEWRNRQIKLAKLAIEESKPQDQKNTEAWLALKKEIDRSAGIIFQIDTKKVLGYDRSAFVNSIYGRLRTFAKNVDAMTLQNAIEYILQLGNSLKSNGGKPIFTSRHTVWKLSERGQHIKQSDGEQQQKEQEKFAFDGGFIAKNYAENRLQIFHDEKPAREFISNLKSHGFRWAPSFCCWQRQLTSSAICAAVSLFPQFTYEQLAKGL